MPLDVRNNLTWWNTLLPTFNGVLFFDDPTQEVFQLYIDASLLGLRGFFHARDTSMWPEVAINQSEAFISKTPNFRGASSSVIPPSAPAPTQSYLVAPPLAAGLLSPTIPSINVFEVEAILLAFQLFFHTGSKCCLIISTNNTTAYSGMTTSRLWGSPNTPLQKIMFLAAKYNILIEPR